MKWTREGLCNARRHYLERTLEAQLTFVYDILMACYNAELNIVQLTILGTDLFYLFLLLQENQYADWLICTTMEFQNMYVCSFWPPI